jgi:hypothetical protein
MCKIEIHRQGLRDIQVCSKLFTIIGGNAFKRRNPFEQRNHGLGHQISLFAGDTLQQGKARFAFCQSDDRTLLIFFKHQVHFPVSKTSALLDNLWTLFDAFAIGDFAPVIPFDVTLVAFLLTTQVGPQGSASPFVRVNVMVNMLITNCNAFFFEPSRNLFRAPLFSDLLFYQSLGFDTDLRLCLFSPPTQSHFMGLFGSIATLLLVSPYFSTDGRFVDFQLLRYFCLVVAYIQQRFYLVSLFSGKLCVTHIVPMSFGISAHLTWSSESTYLTPAYLSF